jgi:hypothetical protein
MSTKHPDLFKALAAPFDAGEIKSRSQSGRQFHYITARTAMNRLDNVLGPEGWWDEYCPGEKSVLCKLTIRLPDGSTLTKADAGGYAGMSDSGDDDKSGYSDAFKRACSKFGVGRYLYGDGVPEFATADGHQVPAPAARPDRRDDRRPEPSRQAADGNQVRGQWGNAPRADRPQPAPGGPRDGGQPRTGKALWAWLREHEERHPNGAGLTAHVMEWAAHNGFPDRCFRWEFDQIKAGHAQGKRFLSERVGTPQRSENGYR